MAIQVRIKNNYGTDMIYPVCEKAVLFAKLKGQKTLTSTDIALIKSLGYAVQVLPEVVAL